MPDADAAWRCPRGCDPCVHFDAALRKDIVDDMLHKYGFDFKEAPRPMIIDSAPIVITAPMMIDPAFPLCGRDSSLKWLVDLLVRTAIAYVGFTLRTHVWRLTDGLRTRSARTSRALHGGPSASLGLKTSWSGLAVPQSSGMTRCEWCLHGWQMSCQVAGSGYRRGYQGVTS